MGVAFIPTGIAVVFRTLIDFNYRFNRSGSAILSSAVLIDTIELFSFMLSSILPVLAVFLWSWGFF